MKSNLFMRKIRNFLCFFICSFHLNCPTTEEQFTDRQVLLGEPKRFRVTRNIACCIILEEFSSDIELKEKARHIYTDLKTNDEKMDKLIGDMERLGFVELENELDGTYKVTAAFHYIEELIDCLTIIEPEQA